MSFFVHDLWKHDQVGVGVSRCPHDADQSISVLREIEAELKAFPLFSVDYDRKEMRWFMEGAQECGGSWSVVQEGIQE